MNEVYHSFLFVVALGILAGCCALSGCLLPGSHLSQFGSGAIFAIGAEIYRRIMNFADARFKSPTGKIHAPKTHTLRL